MTTAFYAEFTDPDRNRATTVLPSRQIAILEPWHWGTRICGAAATALTVVPELNVFTASSKLIMQQSKRRIVLLDRQNRVRLACCCRLNSATSSWRACKASISASFDRHTSILPLQLLRKSASISAPDRICSSHQIVLQGDVTANDRGIHCWNSYVVSHHIFGKAGGISHDLLAVNADRRLQKILEHYDESTALTVTFINGTFSALPHHLRYIFLRRRTVPSTPEFQRIINLGSNQLPCNFAIIPPNINFDKEIPVHKTVMEI